MSIDLKSLGFTQQELQHRVVDQICQQMLDAHFYDEDGEEVTRKNSSKFYRQLMDEITKKIDVAVSAIAEKHVLPNLTEYVETFVIQETNQYGEKRGKPSMTFTEYLVSRAQEYLREAVDYEGKSEAEERARGNSWYSRATQTRVTHIIEKHLHYKIEEAMKAALTGANAQIANAIAVAAQLKLAEISSKLKVEVKTK